MPEATRVTVRDADSERDMEREADVDALTERLTAVGAREDDTDRDRLGDGGTERETLGDAVRDALTDFVAGVGASERERERDTVALPLLERVRDGERVVVRETVTETLCNAAGANKSASRNKRSNGLGGRGDRLAKAIAAQRRK